MSRVIWAGLAFLFWVPSLTARSAKDIGLSYTNLETNELIATWVYAPEEKNLARERLVELSGKHAELARLLETLEKTWRSYGIDPQGKYYLTEIAELLETEKIRLIVKVDHLPKANTQGLPGALAIKCSFVPFSDPWPKPETNLDAVAIVMSDNGQADYGSFTELQWSKLVSGFLSINLDKKTQMEIFEKGKTLKTVEAVIQSY